jgi:hypothetical protein
VASNWTRIDFLVCLQIIISALSINHFPELDEMSSEDEPEPEEEESTVRPCWGQSTIFHLIFFVFADFTLVC